MDDRRADTMRLLARASHDTLSVLWDRLGITADASEIRAPEIGLVTVRGRIGGDGPAFNLGEVTVTRAAVKLPSGEVGHSYILGRDKAKARLCAVIDAAAQGSDRERIERDLVAPLRRLLDEADESARAEIAATRVDFFTMVRGED